MTDMIEASHILCASTTDAEAARVRIDELSARLADGGNFADLARDHSDCPSARQGGALGRFGRAVMVPAFEEAAFALDVGETSGVIETDFGFHLIRRTA